jgi:hypothetical protein
MDDKTKIDDTDVEDRIIFEFMCQLHDSDVQFELVDGFEELIAKDDFGGKDAIIDLVEEEVIEDGT